MSFGQYQGRKLSCGNSGSQVGVISLLSMYYMLFLKFKEQRADNLIMQEGIFMTFGMLHYRINMCMYTKLQ